MDMLVSGGADDKQHTGLREVVYGLLHLLGAASSCSNPILYGLLNENFMNEYKELYRWLPWYYNTQTHRFSNTLQHNVFHQHIERRNAIRHHQPHRSLKNHQSVQFNNGAKPTCTLQMTSEPKHCIVVIEERENASHIDSYADLTTATSVPVSPLLHQGMSFADDNVTQPCSAMVPSSEEPEAAQEDHKIENNAAVTIEHDETNAVDDKNDTDDNDGNTRKDDCSPIEQNSMSSLLYKRLMLRKSCFSFGDHECQFLPDSNSAAKGGNDNKELNEDGETAPPDRKSIDAPYQMCIHCNSKKLMLSRLQEPQPAPPPLLPLNIMENTNSQQQLTSQASSNAVSESVDSAYIDDYVSSACLTGGSYTEDTMFTFDSFGGTNDVSISNQSFGSHQTCSTAASRRSSSTLFPPKPRRTSNANISRYGRRLRFSQRRKSSHHQSGTDSLDIPTRHKWIVRQNAIEKTDTQMTSQFAKSPISKNDECCHMATNTPKSPYQFSSKNHANLSKHKTCSRTKSASLGEISPSEFQLQQLWAHSMVPNAAFV